MKRTAAVIKRRGGTTTGEYNMAKLNIFADTDALNCLLGMDYGFPSEDIAFTLDFTDLPLWFSFSSNEEAQTLKAYSRGEWHNRSESKGKKQCSLVLDRKTQQGNY